MPAHPDFDIVRHARARRAKLSVDPSNGRIRLTVPPRMALATALHWAEEHRGWIDAQRRRLPDARPFAPGAEIPFGDETLRIEWREGAPQRVVRDGDMLRCGGPQATIGRRVTSWLRKMALETLSAETAEFAARAGVKVTSVSIGDTRSRWGSCANDGAIRYSWRLMLAPAEVRRATVAHEVAHRLHMHHGPEFHAAVEAIYGADPTPHRRWLKANGASLHWFGRESG